MNIRKKVNELIQLQDNITHLNETGRDLGILHAQRTNTSNMIVECVIKLEEKVRRLEARNAELEFQASMDEVYFQEVTE